MLSFVSLLCVTTQLSGEGAGASVLRPLPSPGLKRFPSDILRNLRAIGTKENLPIPLAVAGVFALGDPGNMDGRTKAYFGGTRRMRELGSAGEVLGGALVAGGGTAALLLLSRTSDDERFRSTAYALGQAVTTNALLVTPVKLASRRERPNGENYYSFYSSHTSNAFAAAAVIDRYYGRGPSIAGYTTATLIALSRLESGKHHLSDVVTGAAIGFVVGRTVSRPRQDGSGSRINLDLQPAPGRGFRFGLRLGPRRRG